MRTSQYNTIFEYTTAQETLYRQPIQKNGKMWSMKDTITTAILYRDSDIIANKTDMTPIKNITRPLLNLQFRTEDIDVKDVQLYVDDPDQYHLSFLVRKYHDDVFTKEYDLDSFFDELNQSRITFGAGLSKSLAGPCPENVEWETVAFCDQTDALSAPIGLKHYYSPDQLLDMKQYGWGKESNGATISLEDVIALSLEQKKDRINGAIVPTPGRYIEVYEVHGNLPKKFANPDDDSGEYETQLFIVAFYQKDNSNERNGVILYTKPETESPFKLVKRGGKGDIYGRALGFGGAEELFDAQVWTNYAEIRKIGMLDATSKVLLQTDDPTVTQKQNVRDMENLSVVEYTPGTKGLSQIDTTPRSLALFDNAINEWELHAKDLAAAQDPIQGKAGGHGDPFAAQQAQLAQSMGLHEYRRGIFAKHLEEIYKDWIIPHIQKKITEGTTFLSELSLEELQFVAEALVTNQTNDYVKSKILSGQLVSSDQIQAFKQQALTAFQKKGNKHFIEIIKGEFKDTDLGVKVSIAGKGKDLASMVDKLTNVFRTITANPYILQSPPIAALFNKIIEAAGLEPIDLSGFKVPHIPAMRITENVAFKDLPPEAQKEMVATMGYAQNAPTSDAPAPSALGAPLVK